MELNFCWKRGDEKTSSNLNFNLFTPNSRVLCSNNNTVHSSILVLRTNFHLAQGCKLISIKALALDLNCNFLSCARARVRLLCSMIKETSRTVTAKCLRARKSLMTVPFPMVMIYRQSRAPSHHTPAHAINYKILFIGNFLRCVCAAAFNFWFSGYR